jgi:hypothetical protein
VNLNLLSNHTHIKAVTVSDLDEKAISHVGGTVEAMSAELIHWDDLRAAGSKSFLSKLQAHA